MNAIIIRKENGKWLLNDKPYNQLSPFEKEFFNDFLVAAKIDLYYYANREKIN